MSLLSHVRNCRSCNASIIWARTMSGQRMPVDADFSEDGNVLLLDVRGHARAKVIDLAAVPEGWRGALRRSHFATCPDAPEWRNR